MIGRKLIKTLPLLSYAGTFAVFSACGCGQCPACLGSYASMVGLAAYLGTKKLLDRSSESKGQKEVEK